MNSTRCLEKKSRMKQNMKQRLHFLVTLNIIILFGVFNRDMLKHHLNSLFDNIGISLTSKNIF